MDFLSMDKFHNINNINKLVYLALNLNMHILKCAFIRVYLNRREAMG
jgi:hypothetical protein